MAGFTPAPLIHSTSCITLEHELLDISQVITLKEVPVKAQAERQLSVKLLVELEVVVDIDVWVKVDADVRSMHDYYLTDPNKRTASAGPQLEKALFLEVGILAPGL